MKTKIKKILFLIYYNRIKKDVDLCRLKHGSIIFLFATPTHSNLGDQAIALAERKFLESFCGGYCIVDIPFELYDFFIDNSQNFVQENDIFLCMGGGNMGDLYLREEVCRRKLIEGLPDNKIIIFPQTICFSDTKIGQDELKTTIEVYSKHKNLTIIAREKRSYNIMKDNFKNNKVLLSPDIVLSLGYEGKIKNRDGVLLCMRNDSEKNINKNDTLLINNFINSQFVKVNVTDTISKRRFIPTSRRALEVGKKLNEFRSSQLVITDRLHGMVFAAITGTPCIVFSNYNYKVLGTYNWIKHLPYIKFCNDVNLIKKIFEEIDFNVTYSYSSDFLSSYWLDIKSNLTVK